MSFQSDQELQLILDDLLVEMNVQKPHTRIIPSRKSSRAIIRPRIDRR